MGKIYTLLLPWRPLREMKLSVVCLITAKSSTKPDHFPILLESKSDSMWLPPVLMLHSRRSFWDVWDTLSEVPSVIFLLQIRAPNLKCAQSDDAVEHVCKLKQQIPPLGTIQAQGEREMSELHCNFQIYGSGCFSNLTLLWYYSCVVHEDYITFLCVFLHYIKSPAIGRWSHCSLVPNRIRLLL